MHDHEPERVQPATDERPDQLADRDVARRQGRRQDRRERLVVVELEEEVERALVDRALHRRSSRATPAQRTAGTGSRLATGPRDRADQRAEAEPDAEQIEERLEEARQHARASRACRRTGSARPAAGIAGSRSGRPRSAARRSSAHQLRADSPDREQRPDDDEPDQDGEVRGQGPATSGRRRACRATGRAPTPRRGTAA